MGKKYILAIDQSTSGTKAILFNRECKLHYRVTIAHEQIHPRPEWVEHDPVEIIENVECAIKRVIQEGGARWDEVASISVTNQRETGMVWDRETGRPVYNAIVWQCPRARDICEHMAKDRDLINAIFYKTGLHLSPYFTAPKIRWILDNVNGSRERAKQNKLLFGTMDSWVLWNFTGGKVHATDYTNASRTMLMNLNTMSWDSELLEAFQISESMMPVILHSDAIFGYTKGLKDIPDGIPISGVMGDSHAALFGQNCYRPGMTKATYGTGSSVMMNIGAKPVYSGSGIVTSVGWSSLDDTVFVLEGNINSTGKTMEWLSENMQLLHSPKESGAIASKVPDNDGVYFIPAFTGLGAPYWDNNAKAIITGLTFSTQKETIVRAAEESIAYQIHDIIDCMQKDAGVDLSELRADGGPTRDTFLMQFQSDISNTPVVVPVVEELSALGSANMAGLAVRFWESRAEIERRRLVLAEYTPQMDASTRVRCLKGWSDAVKRALSMNTL